MPDWALIKVTGGRHSAGIKSGGSADLYDRPSEPGLIADGRERCAGQGLSRFSGMQSTSALQFSNTMFLMPATKKSK